MKKQSRQKPAGAAPRMTLDQVDRFWELVRDSDSVEIKLTIPADDHRATIAAVGLDPVEAEPRQVFFFDTPELALNRAGLVVRARRLRGGTADTVVKLRPLVPSELPRELRQSGAFKTEVDVVPGGYVCSGSLKGKAGGDEVRDVAAGALKLSKLLSKEQRAFYREHAPAAIDLDSLSVLGPTFALKSVFTPAALGRKMVAEMWLYPDGSRLLELSTKSAPTEAGGVAAQVRAYFAGHGIAISGVQETKTKAALTFHAGRLKAQARRRPSKKK
jgi:hypothetical protein